MATIQVKRLKAILKELGITENVHLTKYRRTWKNPETGKTERFNEYGPAFSVVGKRHLSPEQLASLKAHEHLTVTHETDNFIHVKS